MTQSLIDTAVAGRSYRFEIGAKRPDGKHNIWTRVLFPERGLPADQVIVHVADSWRQARDWIIDHEKQVEQRAAA